MNGYGNILIQLNLQKQVVDHTWPTGSNLLMHLHFISHDCVTSVARCWFINVSHPHLPGAGCFLFPQLLFGTGCGHAVGCPLYLSNWDYST